MGIIRQLRLCGGLAFCAAIALAGCSTLPTSGPTGRDVKSEVPIDENSLPYRLVRVTPEIIAALAENTGRLTVSYADRQPPREIKFGIGDVVAVTIFEATAGGLFIPIEAGVRPGNFISLPSQSVDSKGNI